MKLTSLFTFIAGVLLFASCTSANYDAPKQSAKVQHDTWSALLKKHVTSGGTVDYKGFIKDSTELNKYLSQLSQNPPAENSDSAYSKAYWINAYNAYTVQLIIRNYPLKSIQDLHPKIKIPKVSTVWHKTFFKIGEDDMSLNYIEHDILRKYGDPRIHVAINCASVSCPKLLNEAYVPEKLDKQLDQQMKEFLADDSKNKLAKDKAQVSSIFNWFEKDFTENGTVIDYINQYSSVKVDKGTKITYTNYDWSLNE